MTMAPDASRLREEIASRLISARERTAGLTECIDEADLIRQHSPLMSPLVWDLAHIANQEELWLLPGADAPGDRPAVRRLRAPQGQAADPAPAAAG
jgi:hypothetical protein